MKFENALQNELVKKVSVDKLRAKSLLKASQQAILTASKIPKTESTFKSIVRELYEGLRQCCEAIGFIKGYKFNSHDCIAAFLKEILAEDTTANKFDRYRKLRNGINYYGDDVSKETVNEALIEIPKLTRELTKYCGELK
ncbi:hypothetical protein COV18_04050 [Candidatus Woesearchaeota archaeon CG10_big_fil_rev_8_21_14_0_10_37_12]|nr:MAG: hypothetical protein COV18_04050 [Candidatus Woesearchaeota archaeon CG10_big_fil_rev_8_21_14_0_10_37_12]